MSEPTNLTAFESFRKIPRLSREIVITEKIDGTNAQILILPFEALDDNEDEVRKQATIIGDGFVILAGSRNRWIQPGNDNFGFAAWVKANAEELLKLGQGRHFGEWFGSGIQRGYGLTEKRFALFNVKRWGGCPNNQWAGLIDRDTQTPGPSCCHVVPILHRGPFSTEAVSGVLHHLAKTGSVIVPGFHKPEGIVIYHTHSGHLFKKTIENDEAGKSE